MIANLHGPLSPARCRPVTNPDDLTRHRDVAKRPTLLVVDDEEGPRQSLRIVFKNDYQVSVASNGA